MARIRTIKPDFFKNVDLSDLKFEVRLLFIGLWVLSDREGRLEDIAKKIKADIFPYDNVNVEKGLKELSDKKFIIRYAAPVAGLDTKIIQVTTFLKHQRPHVKEQPSYFPAPTKVVATHNLGDGLPARKGMDNGKGNEIGNDNGDGKEDAPSSPLKIEPETKKESPPPFAAAPPPIGFMWAADCLVKYFSDAYYERTIEQLCMAKHMDVGTLREWAEAFCRYLTSSGNAAKTMDDFTRHFSNWINRQPNLNLNPKKLFSEYESGNTATGTGKNGNTKGGTIQDAFAAIDRMPD